MSKLAGLFALAVAVLVSRPALADGYGRKVPAPIPVPAPMPVPESFSYYLRGDLNWGFSGNPSYSESGAIYGVPPGVPLDSRSVDTDGIFSGTIGAGAYFSPRLRGDLTLDLRGEQSIDATATYTDVGPIAGTVRDSIRLRGTVGLANVYWDLMERGHFTPYIGGGIGFVYNDLRRSYSATQAGLTVTGSSHDENFGLAGALMAGVALSWDHTWALDIGYRALYMDGGSVTTALSGSAGTSTVDIGSQWEHQIRVGIRVNLW
jgi:opacity protein-like surface antigen